MTSYNNLLLFRSAAVAESSDGLLIKSALRRSLCIHAAQLHTVTAAAVIQRDETLDEKKQVFSLLDESSYLSRRGRRSSVLRTIHRRTHRLDRLTAAADVCQGLVSPV